MDDNELGLVPSSDEYSKEITNLRNKLLDAIVPILKGNDSHLGTYAILAVGSFIIPQIIEQNHVQDYKFISHQCGEALRLQMNMHYESLISEGK